MNDTDSNRLHNLFLPVLLLAFAWLGWMAFETMQLAAERQTLSSLKLSQADPVEQSRKLRAALDSVAASTQRLADGGNASARLLVDELRKRGITINPNATSPPPPQ
jgi:hypothetical protein